MRSGGFVVATVFALGAAGCQTLNDVTHSLTSSGEPAAQPSAPAAPPAAPAEPAHVAAAGGGLAGMSAEALRSAWGEPSLKRSDTGVELWQYGGSSSSCTLLVYLYPGSGNAMTVSRAEAVPGGADDAAVSACAKAAGKPPLKPIS